MDKRKFDSLEDFIKSLRVYLENIDFKHYCDTYFILWSETDSRFIVTFKARSNFFDPHLVYDLLEYLPYAENSELFTSDKSIHLSFLYEKV